MIALAGGPGRALHVRGDGRAADRGGRRGGDRRPVARRGAAGGHAGADGRGRPARGVRGGAVREPPPLRGGGPARPRPAGRSSPRASACCGWPVSSTAARCAGCWTPRRSRRTRPSPATGRRPRRRPRRWLRPVPGSPVTSSTGRWCTPRAGQVPAWTWAGGNPEGFVWRQVHASQLGLHWAGAPEIARRLVAAMLAPVPAAVVVPPPDEDPGEQTLSLSGLTPPPS